MNILILGETGVGKSTWINGILNYLAYPTLEEAEQNEFLHVIPMSFTMTTMDYEEIVVSTGNDNNEDSKAGNSATQWPKTYTFQRGDTLIRLVDTPGIGDVRGVEQDKENFKRILSHLSNLNEIHGICILLKPNNARLTVVFQFCIKELLTHLHMDASKNIVFCFTNARSTFYRPGDTLAPLKRLLADNKNGNIPVSRDTMYCMDNEAVRFLAAVKQGVKFEDDDRKNFSGSWNKSVEETARLFNYVADLPPHKTSDTISLNHSRRMITELTKPMADISKNIQDNIAIVKDKEEEMKTIDITRDDLSKKLKVPAIDLKIEQLNYPQTVCGNSKCMEIVQGQDGISEAVYKQKCHDHCYITGVSTGTKNQTELQGCAAMGGTGEGNQIMCRVCGCPWFEHMHQTYSVTKVNATVEDPNVQKQLEDRKDNREALRLFIERLRSTIQQLEQEQEFITKVSAEFAAFLHKYAITPYNDVMAEYLDHLIRVEKDKVSLGGGKKTLERLVDMQRQYAEEVKILKKALQEKSTAADHITPQRVQALVQQLYDLPVNGPKLKSMMQVVNVANKRAYQEHSLPVSAFTRGRNAGKRIMSKLLRS